MSSMDRCSMSSCRLACHLQAQNSTIMLCCNVRPFCQTSCDLADCTKMFFDFACKARLLCLSRLRRSLAEVETNIFHRSSWRFRHILASLVISDGALPHVHDNAFGHIRAFEHRMSRDIRVGSGIREGAVSHSWTPADCMHTCTGTLQQAL